MSVSGHMLCDGMGTPGCSLSAPPDGELSRACRSPNAFAHRFLRSALDRAHTLDGDALVAEWVQALVRVGRRFSMDRIAILLDDP